VATVLASVGGGLTEVIISPMVEACPTEDKSGGMSLLHSFYCWGQMGTVLLSTLFFFTVGVEHWRLLSVLWAILPTVVAVAFCVVPVYRLHTDDPVPTPVGTAAQGEAAAHRRRARTLFVLFFLMMVCAGAAEQAMSQWASNFAEAALGVDKTLGDILGPCAFALMMALSRTYYGLRSDRMDLAGFTTVSCLLCIVAYLLAALSPLPLLSLIGCGLCGLSVGILWPGTYGRAAIQLHGCSVTTYALLALGGDIGCLIGPSIAGRIADRFGGELRYAFLFALLFPVFGVVLSIVLQRCPKKETPSPNDEPR
jgi:fucose permease